MTPGAGAGAAARPSRGRRFLALAVGLAGTFGAAAGLGLLTLSAERRYPPAWLIGTGVVALVGVLLVVAAIRLARLPALRAVIALLGSLLLVSPVARMVRVNVAGATSYAPAKRTMSEIRELGIAIESLALDKGSYPATSSLDQLAAQLEGRYLQKVPRRDGWRNPLRYEAVGADLGRKYFIGSAGSDGVWRRPRLADYAPGDADGDDIVVSNGSFLAVPAPAASPPPTSDRRGPRP